MNGVIKALGRKGALFLAALVAVFGGAWAVPEALYMTFVGAVLGLYGAFVGSNVAATAVAPKAKEPTE